MISRMDGGMRGSMQGKKSVRKKLNNSGSAIVTVIVVVAFISILATTILYVSGMNFYMKMTDLHTKESFYEAETALEEIKSFLMEQAAEAGKEAYMDVMINYASTDGYTRYSLYQNRFLALLNEKWEAARTPMGGTERTYLETLASLVTSYPVKPIDPSAECELSLDASVPNAGSIELHAEDGYALLRGIIFTYTRDGYTTMISTDFIISVPEINWGVDAYRSEWGTGEDGTPDDASDLERETVDMTECVQYYNWTKQ